MLHFLFGPWAPSSCFSSPFLSPDTGTWPVKPASCESACPVLLWLCRYVTECCLRCVSPGEPVPRSLEGLFVYEERSPSPPANDTIVVEQWTVIEVSEGFWRALAHAQPHSEESNAACRHAVVLGGRGQLNVGGGQRVHPRRWWLNVTFLCRAPTWRQTTDPSSTHWLSLGGCSRACCPPPSWDTTGRWTAV